MKGQTVIFTIDDNIRFLQELHEGNMTSLFSHPYTRLLKHLHDVYDIKAQLNLFYQNETFSLDRMSEKFKKEWIANSNWLKLSFHSLSETVFPYEKSDYEEVFEDCMKVQKEIIRFAGEETLGKTTTIHYCSVTREGLRALSKCGVKGLLGLYGANNNPQKSYQTSELENFALRNGECVLSNGITYANIDIVLNKFEIEEILIKLKNLCDRSIVKIMIHEQYFYKDYFRYQVDFQEKLEQAFSFLLEKGFDFQFFEDLLG